MQREVAPTAFDLADECPVQMGPVSQGFLGKPQFVASRSDPASELGGRGR